MVKKVFINVKSENSGIRFFNIYQFQNTFYE